jgi:GNAT superfamily N-acetyltransferase
MTTVTESIAPPLLSRNIRLFDVRRDLGTVADLIEICFADTLDPDGARYIQRMRSAASDPGMMRWAAISAEWGSRTMSGYVWEEEGRLVGNLSLIPYSLKGQRRYLIANVAVHPDFRRRGIARQLTSQAIAHARQRGIPEVWLHVREENDPAVTLYRSLGFAERARRTTWHSQSDYPRLEVPAGLELGKRRGEHWGLQRQWLGRNYPPEVTWHLQFSLSSLKPGLPGLLARIFGETYLQQWTVRRDHQLQAAVACQASSTFANILWLAAPPQADEEALQALLLHARRQVPSHRPLSLDYPAWQSSTAIQSAGFKAYQTLMWMALSN